MQWQLAKLIRTEAEGVRRDVVLAAGVSGVANAAILVIINTAAMSDDHDGSKFRLLMMFGIAIALYALCLKYTYDKSSQIFEGVLDKIRTRLSRKIKRAELTDLDAIGRAVIYNRLTQEAAVISQSQQILVGALQAVVMVLFVSLYIAYLSMPAFILTIVMTAAAIGIFIYRERESKALIDQASEQEVKLIGAFSALLDGFKQIKVRDRLGEELLQEIKTISDKVRELNSGVTSLANSNNIFAMSFFYVLMAAIVFLLPRFIPTFGEVISELTAAILFIIGPLGLVVSALPLFAKANIAAGNIEALEHELDKRGSLPERAVPEAPSIYTGFDDIAFRKVSFDYVNSEGRATFHFGPIDLEIKAGECLFLIGGNGSGKSTFLKLLTGLYPPREGQVLVDGRLVGPQTQQEYRELFSIIFGDFHLFDRLYGLEDVDPEETVRLIQLMEMQDKVAFDGERFSNLNLSTGQRKRLALIVSILERRPVLVYDEWAADQDPHFREKFYNQILPWLVKDQGKTVIAATHDDHYFHQADRIVKLHFGEIEWIKTPDQRGDKGPTQRSASEHD